MCGPAGKRSTLIVIVGAALLASTCGRDALPPTSPSTTGLGLSAAGSVATTVSSAPLRRDGAHSVEALLGECLAGSGAPSCFQPGPPTDLNASHGRAAPQPPTELTAVVTGNTVTLSWTGAAGGDPATTYVLQGGTMTGAIDLANFPTGNLQTSFASPPLPPGLYFVRVLARSGSDDSAASNEVSFTILAPPGAPLGPPVLSFTLQGSVATFTWTTPKNRDEITGFLFQVGDQAGLSNLAKVTLPPAPTTFTPPPLAAGIYHVRVAALGLSGEVGPDSNEVVVGLVGPPPNARYRVSFEADWSAQTHPDDFPSNPHFFQLIGATHGPGVTFWQPSASASTGIQNVAELGSTSPFDAEIGQAQAAGTAENLFIGGGLLSSPGVVSTEFAISQTYPLVTLVTMIAPSPDWFVGVRDLSMLNGDWHTEIVVELPPWDAGTDSGVTFTSTNAPTVPQGIISLLQGPPVAVGGQVPPFGRFIFRRIE